MYKVIGGTALLFLVGACGAGYANTPVPQTKVYCLEEQERDNFDYMVVTDMEVCNSAIDDVELFETDSIYNNGDVAYVEADGSHSKAKIKLKTEVKYPSNPPAYVPKAATPTKICKISYVKPGKPGPAPKPPAPAPAPVAPKPVQPAPVAPKPVVPAPVNTPKPAVPVPAPTIKPGC